ncbi:MAG TPA: hypothetical protein P5016_14750, partial [Verrucomicrobiales bacterium]|nr:hypothetical protein [Verrucomicrobiales bacterium]
MRNHFPKIILWILSALHPPTAAAADPADWSLPHAWTAITLPDCPVCIAHTSGPQARSVVACQRGLVYVLPEDRQSAELAVFLDFRDRLKEEIHFEAGLHALVFHPDFARNGRFYLTYSQSDPRRCV